MDEGTDPDSHQNTVFLDWAFKISGLNFFVVKQRCYNVKEQSH
jgi:hypothetical protein